MTTETSIEYGGTQKAKKKRSIKDLPGFDISSSSLLEIIDPPCMIVKKSTSTLQPTEMLTLTLIDKELSAFGVDINIAQVTSRGVVAQANGDIQVSVPATQFHALIRNMKGEENISVRLDKEKGKLIVRTDKSSYQLPLYLEPIPYIEGANLKPKFSITFPEDLLFHSVQRVLHAAARNDVRYYLNGIYISVAGGEFNIVATDGHRLANVSVPITFSDQSIDGSEYPVAPLSIKNEDVGAIIPFVVCPVFQNLLKGSKAEFQLDFCESHLTFHLGTITLVSNLVNGRYPDWRRVASAVRDCNEQFVVNVAVLKDAISRALPLLMSGAPGTKSNSTCLMTFKPGAMMIKSPGSNSIACKEVVSAEKVGGTISSPLEIGINAEYFLNTLNSIQSYGGSEADVQLEIKDSLTGVGIRYNNTLDVVMPIRL